MLILAALMAEQFQPRVVSVLEGEEFARRGIVAEMVERPPGIPDELFAQQLINAEGLRPWNGEQLNSPANDGRMATKAVFSGDGREIIIKYVQSDVEQAGQVCRLRLARGGMSEERWKAYRWCAEAFGLILPESPPSPIMTTTQQPR